MRDAREPGPITQAAENAAEAGNYAAAENLLREAAREQEANLGPRHPDLANTLNNLGIVCEMNGKADEAEQYFRRAVSIARTSLAPDHPFVATSQKNLRDFCEVRGRQVELPAPAPEQQKPVQPVKGHPEPEDSQLPADQLFRRVAIGALGPIAMLMVVLAAGLPRLGAPELAAPVPARAIEAPRDIAPPPSTAPVEEIPEATTSNDTPSSTIEPPVVVRARLCGDLDEWSCDPADRPVPPGPLYFYTELTSTSATTVEHRWYHDDRLLKTVKLQVEANKTGYRTYSRRNLMESDTTGSWKIELRSEDGTVLHEERFTVR